MIEIWLKYDWNNDMWRESYRNDVFDASQSAAQSFTALESEGTPHSTAGGAQGSC